MSEKKTFTGQAIALASNWGNGKDLIDPDDLAPILAEADARIAELEQENERLKDYRKRYEAQKRMVKSYREQVKALRQENERLEDLAAGRRQLMDIYESELARLRDALDTMWRRIERDNTYLGSRLKELYAELGLRASSPQDNRADSPREPEIAHLQDVSPESDSCDTKGTTVVEQPTSDRTNPSPISKTLQPTHAVDDIHSPAPSREKPYEARTGQWGICGSGAQKPAPSGADIRYDEIVKRLRAEGREAGIREAYEWVRDSESMLILDTFADDMLRALLTKDEASE